MGTPLGPKYIPYTYMDPLGLAHSGAARSHGAESLRLPPGSHAEGFHIRFRV